MVIESAYDFHLRAKRELYKSLIDGIELENASANYEFSKMNATRHGLTLNHHTERLFDEASEFFLKARRRPVKPYRQVSGEKSGLANAPWIENLKQFAGGHENPREAHSSWPSINGDNNVAFSAIGPWSMSPMFANQEWGQPAWLETLAASWMPHMNADGDLTNYHHSWLIPEVRAHEERHKNSFHNQPSHLGRLDGEGNIASPQDLYLKHFYEWLLQQPEDIQALDRVAQRDAHLEQYKKVWAGKERDPLEPYDTGSHSLGFLGYALGLEWLKPSERDAVIKHISEHGFDPSKRMPFVNPGWVLRNWKGRYGSELMHRLRASSMPGSGIPAQYYDFRNEKVKEAFQGRRLLEALKDIHIYGQDIPMANIKRGDMPIGYFDDDGNFVQDPNHSDSHFLIARRNRKEKAPHLIENRDARQMGLETLHDYLINTFGNIPRYMKGDDGDVQLTVHNDQHPDNAFSSMKEFDELLAHGFLDENQHAVVKDYMHDLSEEYERHKQISNGIAPYLNMYHHSEGEEGDMRMSPYALFMALHHGSGGHGDDPTSPITELHHMFSPDVWRESGQHGLFTLPDQPTSQQYIIPLREGDNPASAFPEKIWPKQVGRRDSEGGIATDDYREEAMQMSLNMEGRPRESMQNMVGFMSDLPPEAGSALPFHILDGKIQSWPQLAISHDPQYHHDFGRAYPVGPLMVGEWKTDEEGKGTDYEGGALNDSHFTMNRNTLNHTMNDRGRRQEKQRALLANLWGGWDLHPADIPPNHNLVGINAGQMVTSPNTWQRQLRQHAQSMGSEAIPGHNHTMDDINTRIKQMLMHADIGREDRDVQALPLNEPAAESFAAEQGLGRLNPSPQTSSPGMAPGETWRSKEGTGWLDEEPGQWYMYQPTDELPESGPVDETMVRDFTRRQHIEPIQTPTGEQPHRFSFPFRNAALRALADGETDCPVCNGDGHIDDEDLQKSLFDIEDEKPKSPASLFDIEDEPSEGTEERPVCPNCKGTGKHKFSQEALQSRILPSPQQHIENKQQMGMEAFLDTPEDERDEEWYNQMMAIEATPSDVTIDRNPTKQTQQHYFTSKYLTTVDLVANVARSLADKVRKQFEADGLPDPFAPDQNGDWSQAHVNALALWSHANEWALRAQPQHRDWDNDHIHGIETADDEGYTPNSFDRLQAGASIYFPHAKNTNMTGFQTSPAPLPLSLFNSHGYRMKYGWKMSPTFGVAFNFEGQPSVLHNQGVPAADKQPYLNVPLNQLQTVFPDMQPMSKTHPSAPSADDIPEQHKMGESGESVTFNLSEDDIPVSTLLKSLTDPDILKEKSTIKPIKAAHRIFSFDDMKHLRGFSGDWVVSSWFDGYRVLIHKQGKKVDARFADGSKARLSSAMRKGLIDANEDRYVADAIIKKNEVVFIDLLEHGHKELYEEPLKDRITRLRSQFESTDVVLMPAPYNTRRTDDEGLEQAVENIQAEDNDGVLLRDAISTYMKGESRHPKWVLMRNKKELDVIILNRRGSGPFMYQLGIGPINEERAESLGNRAVQHDKKWYMDVGTLARERKPFVEGDFVRVSVSSVTDSERDGKEVYNIQPIKIIGESQTHATDSVESLNVMTKGYAPIIFPHDVIVKESTIEIHIPHMEDAVIYKSHQWGSHWMLDKPMSMINDLSDSDYAVHMAESLRPFWQPVVAMSLNHLLKLDYNPKDTTEKSKDELEEDEEEHIHEVAFEVKKPKKMGDDHILKPETTKMMTKALALIDTYLAKEASTWTGARGMGVGLGTPDSAPRGPTEITSDSNTLDYDMRERDEDESDKPKKNKATGKVQDVQEIVETDEGEMGEIRVTEDEATLQINPNNSL